MDRSALLPLAAVDVGIVGFSFLPALSQYLLQRRERKPRDNFYEDVDGKATPETLANFSQKWPKTIIVLLACAGFATSLAISVLIKTKLHIGLDGLNLENWLSTAAWATILAQAIILVAQHDFVLSYEQGLWCAFSCLATSLNTIAQTVVVSRFLKDYGDPSFILRIVNCALAFILMFACCFIPRRPEVFFRDRQVDRKLTSHAFDRMTWGWVKPLINYTIAKGDLEEKDIPEPDRFVRAGWLVAEWNRFNFSGKLVWSVLKAYRWKLIFQWSLVAVRCVVGLAPFWVVYRIISIIEEMGANKHASYDLWTLIALLALAKLTEQWLDFTTNWFSMSSICYPLRGQLASLIFQKSLRRNNVKTAEKEEKTSDSDDKPNEEAQNKDDNGKKDKKDKKDDETVLKTRQAVVNLIGVDTRRVAGFVGINFIIPNCLGKLLVYSIYLVQLIGWVPFIAGIAVWALILPLNTIVSRKYVHGSNELMKSRDEKLAVVNEALTGMRQIKFSALEQQWEKRILEMREKEIKNMKKVFTADAGIYACWVLSPIGLTAASLVTYAYLNGGLAPSTAFVAVSVFKSLEVTLGLLPELFTMLMDTLVSVRRMDAYLKGPEMKQILTKGPEIAMDGATVAWPTDEEVPDEERYILNDINLNFPRGQLSVISGKTGTGKSLLLAALLGEVNLLDGSITMPSTVPDFERDDAKAHPGNWILNGSVAFVPQSPWLESTSLRDNILFGLPYHEARFKETLEACALTKDVESLTDGDKTELGANGVNLSGGQKWRVTLARAVYSRAEILVMDDIFSAVDAHVGRQIFEKCIDGEICRGRTRILVTHHVALVQSKAKFLVEVGDGSILNAGLVDDLAEDGTLQKIKSHEQSETEIRKDAAFVAGEETAVNSEEASVAEAVEQGEDADASKAAPETEATKFIQDEGHEKGRVKQRVYGIYISASGGFLFWTICFVAFVGYVALDISRNWWLKIWTGSDAGQDEQVNARVEHGHAYAFVLQDTHHAQYSHMVAKENNRSLNYYLWVYVAIALSGGIVGSFRFLWTFVMSLRASRLLFKKVLFAVLRTPMRWLDTVPVGRILNRLTADFDIIDSSLTLTLAYFFLICFNLMGISVAAAFVSGYTIILAVALLLFSAYFGRQYLIAVRPVKRLESNAKSPMFDTFNAALVGVSSIRAYQKTAVYIEKMNKHMDHWNSATLTLTMLSYWIGARMTIIGLMYTTSVGIFIIASPLVDASLAGFALSFALEFSSNTLMLIRQFANVEMNMNAAERVIEYSDLKTEKLDGEQPAAAWPTKGTLEIKNLDVAYDKDLPLVLKNLSFNVNDNERVGVVGRTGAGKSSLTLALFRFIEPRAGSVFIDGVDTSKIDLHSLRSRLAIIPQDPVLFSGSVRSNLDPFDNYTDAALRDCLARVHLIDSTAPTPANEPSSAAGSTIAPKNVNIFKDLSSGISESGGNLSQGQRQLLCLARAIISRPKIMILDEATSAVDMETDTLIQRSIREEFTDCSLLVIAHRLSTIADFDKILVLSDGEVAQFGTPKELWHQEEGIFRDMCEKSGEKDKLRDTILAQES